MIACKEFNEKSFGNDKSLAFNPYEKPVRSTRKGAIFQVHPYPTKINYRSIAPFILAHAQPGDLVYDSFAGSCSTGMAAASCSEKNPDILNYLGHEAREAAIWGPRRAICIDIGVLPTFIGRTLLNSIDTRVLKKIFYKWMENIEEKWGWIYKTTDLEGKKGIIRYTYFSDIIKCSNCHFEVPFIEMFVDFNKGEFKEKTKCPNCYYIIDSKNVEPIIENAYDKLLKKDKERVKRIPYRIYGTTNNKKWSRNAITKDYEDIKKIEKIPLPDSVKPVPMMGEKKGKKWGEMYRSGYHRDITHVHHFYTPRNLTAISVLFDETKNIPEKFRSAIILAISSYNIANSTLMTRFVFKKGNNRPVNTSAQPGVLYIPNCPVEKNVFLGVRRKFKAILKALEKTSKWIINVEVKTQPAQHSGLKSGSVDYIFTDPPFGENIQYSELNFLSEAWLGFFTDNTYETIISNYQGKDVKNYEKLLTEAFRENFRVLKPGGFMTVVFHNTRKEIWNALQRSILHSGFEIIDTSILDKTQTSFKQTTTKGAVKKDPIILALKPKHKNNFTKDHKLLNAREYIIRRLKELENRITPERSFDYLFGRFVGYRLSMGQTIPINAKEFKRILSQIADEKGNNWYLKKEIKKALS
ncbi:DNA methylase [Patescibacteria group bacterium]|nr:DNA methylase [Patescibacteria group bacterium]